MMLHSTEKILATDLSRHVIHDIDLASIFKGSSASRYGIVNKALKKRELIPLRRGLYMVAPKYLPQYFSLYYLANHIVEISYVTAESALGFHGWIPERATAQIVSVTTFGRSREFSTELAQFIYHVHPIRKENFLIGVNVVIIADKPVWMATPLRALIDYIYWHKIDNANLKFLSNSLRIENDNIIGIKLAEINELGLVYKSARVHKFLAALAVEI